MPPAADVSTETADMTHSTEPPERKKTICVDGRDERARLIATGLRPSRSARRPPRTRPTRPGSAVVTVRNSAMPEFEKSRTSVRYLFMSCDDGALNTLARNADRRRAARSGGRSRASSSSRTLAARDRRSAPRARGTASSRRGARAIARREEDRERAGDERDAPAVGADVGERQRDDREREAEAAGEREHRRRVRARAFGCLLDHGDAGDGQRS